MATQDEYIRTALRVPRALHEQIHEAAKAAGHSFNAEIIARLQSTFGPQRELFPAPLPPEFTQLLDALKSGAKVTITRAGTAKTSRGKK